MSKKEETTEKPMNIRFPLLPLVSGLSQELITCDKAVPSIGAEILTNQVQLSQFAGCDIEWLLNKSMEKWSTYALISRIVEALELLTKASKEV